ncbi:MAG: hypothetical protein C0524_02535 [Rhodobacter sp.]|nr:hypothetical protein [Rhodobacter sp.]
MSWIRQELFRMPQIPTPRRRMRTLMLSISALAFLTACGGGEDDGVDLSEYLPNFAAPAPVLGVVISGGFSGISGSTAAAANTLLASPEYQNTATTLTWLRNFLGDQSISGQLYAMRSSGAAFAHAAGVTGDGELIAISDEHLSPDHDVFVGKAVVVDSNYAAGDEHGTSVASVALGNSPDFVGTAPDADLLFGTYVTDADLISLGEEALSRGAVAWNNSWGFSGLYVDQSGFNSAFSGASGQQYLATLDAYAAQGVVVFAVSNDESEVDSGIMDGLPYLRPSLEAGWIAAVNGVPTFQNGTVASVDLLSSPCLQAARWCMVADGTWNAATGSGSSYAPTTGSSFAAPQIAGALALLAEAFPTLTPHDLRIRLLASAEDDFFTPDDTVELADGYFKGYSVIYGHGFLDIEAALRPIGPTVLSMANGNSVSTLEPVLLAGSGFGDAIEVGLAGTSVSVRDALSASFVMPGEALTAGARPGSQAGGLLAKSLRTNLSADRTAAPTALADPFAAFPGPVLTLAAPDGGVTASVLVPQGGADSLGFTLTRVLADGPIKVELGLKLARDSGQLMSLDGEDAATMASVALGITQDLGNGAFLALSGEMGLTDLGGATALSEATSARFDALKLTAGQSDIFTKGDRISVGVGMPVAIASGTTELNLPVYREGASVSFEDVALNLAPEDRQLDLEVTYQTALTDGLEMKLSLLHSDDFGNRADAIDTAGAIAFAFRF